MTESTNKKILEGIADIEKDLVEMGENLLKLVEAISGTK